MKNEIEIKHKVGAKNKKKGLYFGKSMQLYLLLCIPITLVFIFSYLPMVGIIIAFKSYSYNLGIFKSEWVGIDNFKALLSYDNFSRVAWNTISLNIVFIILGMTCAVLLAITLFEIINRTKVKVFQTILITPNFLSWVIVGYMVYGLLNPEYGILNNILVSLGFKKIMWYSNANLWPGILSIANVWKNVGMDSVLYYAALMSIDSSMIEAAEIDGANKLHVIRYITIPQLFSLMTILLILKVGGIFRADFGLFYQITRNVGELYKTTDVMDTYIFRLMKDNGNFSLSTAASLLQSVIGLIMVLITNYIAKKVDPDRALF